MSVYKKKSRDNEIDDPHAPNTKFVDQHYLGFIADNLLAYTVIFQQLLPRFSRIDIASPKNALMLFRVCKVSLKLDISIVFYMKSFFLLGVWSA